MIGEVRLFNVADVRGRIERALAKASRGRRSANAAYAFAIVPTVEVLEDGDAFGGPLHIVTERTTMPLTLSLLRRMVRVPLQVSGARACLAGITSMPEQADAADGDAAFGFELLLVLGVGGARDVWDVRVNVKAAQLALNPLIVTCAAKPDGWPL